MKSLDRQSLEEQTRLVSRYVAGDLSRSERAEFEAWLIASPELAAEVEMERRLRRGIASAARRGWLRRGVTAPARRDRRWRVAIAASLLASIAVGWSLLLPREDRATTAGNAPARATRQASQTIPLIAMRGSGVSGPNFTFSRATMAEELVLVPEVVILVCDDGTLGFECLNGAQPSRPQFPEYDVAVFDANQAPVWNSQPQIPVNGTQLSFAWRGAYDLVPGDYTIAVRGRTPDAEDPLSTFTLRITQ